MIMIYVMQSSYGFGTCMQDSQENANAGSLQGPNGWINFFRTTKNTKTK